MPSLAGGPLIPGVGGGGNPRNVGHLHPTTKLTEEHFVALARSTSNKIPTLILSQNRSKTP